MTISQDIPSSVLAAYDLADAVLSPVAGGLINQTFCVSRHGRPRVVLQRLHPIFGARVNLDIDAVTSHLANLGLMTPRLVRTVDDQRWVEHQGQVWRALTYVPGTIIHRIDTPAVGHAAGALVGRFHRAVAGLGEYTYAFTRAGVHDTAEHLARLERARVAEPTHAEPTHAERDAALLAQARTLAERILDTAATQADLLHQLAALPLRHCHGDLKISNILFAADDTTRALCLLDLDTLGRQNMAYELGDALRSWCNPRGEDIRDARVDQDILRAAMDGYRRSVGDLLMAEEWAAVIPGLEIICVELAARFCADVFEDRYFGWDATRFASRREHNLLRALGQLNLARSVRDHRDALMALLAQG